MYLTIEGALEELHEMGFREITLRAVKHWADDRRLPFFKFRRRLYIDRDVLHRTFREMQQEAIDKRSK